MMYPRVLIDTEKFRHNVETVKARLNHQGIGVFGVTKVFCGDYALAEAMAETGIEAIADSRIDNLRKFHRLPNKKVLLRIPMHSEAEDVISFSDISLNSEISTLTMLSKEAVKQGRIHGVILMVDLGDLREGFLGEKDLNTAVEKILKMKGLYICGIGTNLTCYGAVIPTADHMDRLIDLAASLEKRYGLHIHYISGGNSSSYHLTESGAMPGKINNLRIGELFVCGRETAYGGRVKETYDDVFVLEAEVIEIKEKPSVPIGESGLDAFGQRKVFVDKGNHLRAICAVGQQDVNLDGLIPVDQCVEIIGGSSDHLILDITAAMKTYEVGEAIQFKLKYSGILSVMSGTYVNKVYTKQWNSEPLPSAIGG